MIINKIKLLTSFHHYNEKYFNGILPIPNFKITHSYKTLGCFKCKKDSNNFFYNYTIEVSDNYDYTESQLRNIMVHEMIHYYLLYVGLDMKCTHKYEFQKIANELNTKYNFEIMETANLNDYKLKEGKSTFMFNLCTFF